MTPEQYYTAPPQKVFDEIKAGAMVIWNEYGEPYRTEKLDRIKDIQNVQDNAWFMVAMFDHINRGKLLSMVSTETAEMIRDAMSPV
jgi:hypothetical protein